MARITQLVLDILKPHDPPLALFTRHLAEVRSGLTVSAEVIEIDEHTETLTVCCEGSDLDLEEISEAISAMGGSLHSVDKVRVINDTEAG